MDLFFYVVCVRVEDDDFGVGEDSHFGGVVVDVLPQATAVVVGGQFEEVSLHGFHVLAEEGDADPAGAVGHVADEKMAAAGLAFAGFELLQDSLESGDDGGFRQLLYVGDGEEFLDSIFLYFFQFLLVHLIALVSIISAIV